jgi:hypothetical protein
VFVHLVVYLVPDCFCVYVHLYFSIYFVVIFKERLFLYESHQLSDSKSVILWAAAKRKLLNRLIQILKLDNIINIGRVGNMTLKKTQI